MPLDYTVAVFDLDNCLMDARAVGPLFEPAFDAVRQANQGALSPQALDQALQACWFTAFDLVAQRHHFTPAMRAAGWEQFSQMEARAPPQIRPQRTQTRGFERNRRQALVEYALNAIENIVIYRCALDTPRRVGRDHRRQSAPTLADLARFSP